MIIIGNYLRVRALLERQIIYMTVNTGSRGGEGATRRNRNAVRTGRSTGPKNKDAYRSPSRITGRGKPGESQEVTQNQRAAARLTPGHLRESMKEMKLESFRIFSIVTFQIGVNIH